MYFMISTDEDVIKIIYNSRLKDFGREAQSELFKRDNNNINNNLKI